MIKPIKVVLLCGGIGKRMVPITKDKTLLNFCGKPLIIHQINTAKEAGLNQFVVIANPDNIADLKQTIAGIKDINIDFALQQKPSGMADALLSAADLLISEPFILVNSNDIFEASAYIQLLSEYQRHSDYFGYLVARQVQDYFPGGYLAINKNSEIHHIVEKPPKGKEPSNLINIVVHLHTHPKKLLDYLTKTISTSDDAYEKALDQIIHDGNKMKAVIYSGVWQAIKYPWHILDAMDYFLGQVTQQISPEAQISEKAIVDGDVIIEQKSKVLEGAIIRGPSYIGQNSIIGNGVLVRNSIIGADCVIGYGTEIKHSYIGDRCWFHSNYIGDSVIEGDCAFGAGTVTANFRLDEANISLKLGDDKIDTGRDKLGALVGKGCRIGINASLMPGVQVGPNSFVGSQICLTHNLEVDKMALAEPQYRVSPNKIELVDSKRQELFKKLTD